MSISYFDYFHSDKAGLCEGSFFWDLFPQNCSLSAKPSEIKMESDSEPRITNAMAEFVP